MKTAATTIILFFAISAIAQQLEVEGDIDVKNNNVINLADPSGPQDAVTKAYVDLLESRILAALSGELVADVEGNYYKVKKFGNQYWTTENLRTTKYHDGTDINHVTFDSVWISADSAAYCWPSNDPDSLGLNYGALYNHYAVSDTFTRNVCPVGWHVPSDAEWTLLSDYLTNLGFGHGGGGSDIGKAMASQIYWQLDGAPGNVGNDQNSNNASGFDGRPPGHRSSVTGQFLESGASGYWWTSSASSPTHGRFRDLMSSSPNLNGNSNFRNRKNGFSVRCVKD